MKMPISCSTGSHQKNVLASGLVRSRSRKPEASPVNRAAMLNGDLRTRQTAGIYVFLLDVAIHPRESGVL